MPLLDIFWTILMVFAFFAYLMVMFTIITDLFRDHETSGWAKAGWVVGLIVLPFLTALIYLGLKGQGMAQRNASVARAAHERQEEYVRSLAGTTTPADEIARAKGLLDQGVIDQAEYERLKAKALA